MKFRNNKGFTLIELLIVLAILGILVGIVAMSVGGLVGTARTTGLNSEKEIVQTAIDTYNTQNVAVGLDPAIPVQSGLTVIGPNSGPASTTFGQYLKRTTKYYYQWTAGGAVLTQDEDGS